MNSGAVEPSIGIANGKRVSPSLVGAETTDPFLVIDPVGDVERSKAGCVQIDRKLIKRLIKLVVGVQECVFLIVAIAISHHMVGSIHRARKTRLVESGEDAEVVRITVAPDAGSALVDSPYRCLPPLTNLYAWK